MAIPAVVGAVTLDVAFNKGETEGGVRTPSHNLDAVDMLRRSLCSCVYVMPVIIANYNVLSPDIVEICVVRKIVTFDEIAVSI